MSSDLLPGGSATGGKSFLPVIDQTSSAPRRDLHGDAAVIRHQAGDLHSSTKDLHHQLRVSALNRLMQEWGKKAPNELLEHVSSLGFAWRDIARMIHVSVPAVQKWRRGERITGENRLRLTRLIAVIEMITVEHLVSDPASWFEMPIEDGVAVTPIDLYATGKTDLLLDWVSNHEADPVTVLDKFDADWRQHYVDENFETFTAEDGELSIRPRPSV
ncbi:hypothetical protein [Pseudarthrobacter sp. S9]|uniref:hypothetical protein n=1 Tax=Pseudarthrobacter sp. S9 TaxID=3418421 RepID=UPI003D033A07